MSRHLFELSVTALLVASFAACNKDGEQPAPDAQASAEAPAESSEPSEPSAGLAMQPRSGPMMQQMRASCPMVVEGAEVEVSDTDSGVALSFTTDAENVGQLRERVEKMAAMYALHQGRGRMMWHAMGPGKGTAAGRGMGMGTGMGMGQFHPGHAMGMGGGAGPMPAASAKVEPTDDGARLVLTPTDGSQLEALREHARGHAERMQSRECWMLQGKSAAP